MSKGHTVVPNRFRQEPLDAVAYDLWQDHEGLTDASTKCRVAWELYRGEWRKVRKADLREPPVQEWKKTISIPRSLIRCGRAFGHVSVSGSIKLTADERQSWSQFKARVIRADPNVWGMFWRYVNGEPLSLTADRFNVEPRFVLSTIALCVRWWEAVSCSGEVELWRGCYR